MFWTMPEASVSRLIRCVRSGPYVPRAGVPRTAWQLTHDCARNAALPVAHRRVVHRRLRLVRQPALELVRRVDDHAEQHVGVLRAAVLGALAEVQARLVGLKHIELARPGIRSILPASRGTQKLWHTSADFRVR